MSNILVTGGAGYIGAITVQRLRDHGYQPVVLDSLEKGHRAAIGDTPLVEGDIRDGALLDRLFADWKFDAVMHFAAYKAVGESVDKPLRYFQNNVGGTMSLLEAMQRASIPFFIFSSTCAVYGTPETAPVDESHPLAPESPYGESKMMSERMLSWLSDIGIRSVSLRYYNAAGAALDGSIGESPARTESLVPRMMQAALGTGPALKVFGTDYPTPDGTAIRDYVHVLDLAEAHIKALDYLKAGGKTEIFNLGTGVGTSVKQVLDTATRITGRTIPVEYTDRRPGDAVAVWADTRKAQQLLGWQAQYDLEAIIDSAWRWHSTHPEGYR